MGIITILLIVGGYLTNFDVPFWVIACHVAISLNLASGWRIVKTMAHKITQLRPYRFCAETAGGIVLVSMAV